MAESFAGITVPEGEPGAVRQAASTFRGVAGALHGVSGDLRAVPGLVADWKGPASAAFGQTAVTNGSCVDSGAEAMHACAQAASTYADELEQAQREARAAIREARDAQSRIDAAQADIENARQAQVGASYAIQAADARIAMATAGMPDAGAVADRDAASQALADAQAAEADGRRRLEQAQDDLDRAKRRGERAEDDARDAARAAAGAFDGVAGASVAAAVFGGSPTAIEDRVLARVRAGDYSVLDEVPLNYLPEDTQRAIGAEVARDSAQAAYNEGDHSIGQMAGIAGRYEHDEEFATGFYNELGGRGTADFASNLIFFQGRGEGLDDPELVAVMAPFATLLGTATRAGGLQRGFTSGFLRHDLPPRDRLGGHRQLTAFVMAGEASNYSGRFLADVGREVLIVPQDPTIEDMPPHVELSEHQGFIAFMAGNPEAAGRLLAGTHGDGHFSNASALMLYGPRYTDDGEALGALITAGAHELRSSDMALANDAAHAVIQATPTFAEHLGDGAKPALVTILDDHIADFEYVATDRAEAGTMERPDDAIASLTYEEGQAYLEALVADEQTREPTAEIVADRVAEDFNQVGGTDDIRYAQRAGALSEMTVLATAEANIDGAERAATMDKIANFAAGKFVQLAPPARAPVVSDLVNYALGEIFSGDHVQHALEENNRAQVEAFTGVKQMSIASQVAHGRLPQQVLETLNPDGTMNLDFVGGRGDDVVRSSPDGRRGEPLAWDLDENGEIDADEREITESELYAGATGPAEVATDAIRSLYTIQYDGAHPPDIDDLPVPQGLGNEDPSTFERIWEWPFDAPGEGTIEDGEHVAARQDDLRWDPRERVYHLPVEMSDGTRSELHYQRFGNEWKLVEKVGGQWEPVN
jgi:hypothetical protein